jgi:hypothetical protein
MYGIRDDSPAPADLRIDRSRRSTWPTGKEDVPRVGQRVFCTEGMAEVVQILGRTGNGSRLLQLRLIGRTAPPFHAAASNVLVEPSPEPGAVDSETPARPALIGELPGTPDPR